MRTEIIILFAGWAFAGTTDVTCFNFLRTKEPVADGTLEYAAADIVDLFGSVGSFSISGGIHVMVNHTLLTKEFAMASRTCVTGLLSTSLLLITTLS